MIDALNITLKLPQPTPRFFSKVYDECGVRLYRGDALGLLPELPSESVDCVVTDPAYWTLEEHRNVGTTTRLGGGQGLADFEQEERGWFKTITAEELFFCVREFARITRPDSHTWLMADGYVAAYLGFVAEHLTYSDGRKVFSKWKQFPVLKRAKNGNLKFGQGYHGRGSHEFVVLLKKGKRPMEGGRKARDTFDHLWVGGEESARFTPDGEEYPTAKPVSLWRQLLGFSAKPDETVLDCFAGSGTLVDAAADVGCNVILCDRSERSIQTITNRVLAAHGGASMSLALGAAAPPEPEAADDKPPMLF